MRSYMLGIGLNLEIFLEKVTSAMIRASIPVVAVLEPRTEHGSKTEAIIDISVSM